MIISVLFFSSRCCLAATSYASARGGIGGGVGGRGGGFGVEGGVRMNPGVEGRNWNEDRRAYDGGWEAGAAVEALDAPAYVVPDYDEYPESEPDQYDPYDQE